MFVLEELSSGWRQRVLQLTILFSLLGYTLFSVWGGGEAVLRSLGQIGLGGILEAFLWVLAAQFTRFLRWQWNGKHLGLTLSWKKNLIPFFSGFALMTTSTQAKGALRGALLQEKGVPLRKSLGILFVEQVSSGFMLVFLLGICLYRLGFVEGIYLPAILVLVLILLQKGKFFEKYSRLLPSFSLFSAFRTLFKWKVFFPSLLFAGCAFLLEGASLFGLLSRLHSQLEWDWVFLVLLLAQGGAVLSMIPSGLGSFELILWQLFLVCGIADAAAVAATVSYRYVSLWVLVLLGFLAQFRQEKM